MADESFELEDGEVVPSVVHCPSAADVAFRSQLDEAATVLRNHGQPDLARLARALVEANLRDAMWVLEDPVRGGGGDFLGNPSPFDVFRHTIRMHLLNLQETGYDDEDDIPDTFPHMVLEAAQHAARFVQAYGGFRAVPASAAAIASLEKLTFRATAGGGDDDDGFTECSICSEEFVDGVQVTVMPCPSRVHKFHPHCISKWLAISNVCPLCRHELPAADYE